MKKDSHHRPDLDQHGQIQPLTLVAWKLLRNGGWRAAGRLLLAGMRGRGNMSDYQLWRLRHQITPRLRRQMRRQAARQAGPKISVILPIRDAEEGRSGKTAASVKGQIYPHWQLCLAQDTGGENGSLSAALNSALQSANGEYLILLNRDDQLAEQALFRVAQAIAADPAADVIYSDEDRLAANGEHVEPFFKPDWSPEYFLAFMYTGRLAAFRTDLVRKLGGWRSEFAGAEEYDLLLRMIRAGAKIAHLPDILYHRRSDFPPPGAAARRALQSHLDSTASGGRAEPGTAEGIFRVRYALRGQPLVSIVIPSACRGVQLDGRQSWFVLECIASIRRSTYQNIEIIVLDNHDMPEPLAKALLPLGVRRIPFPEPFNLSRKMNLGASAARGEQLILLNDDIEVITPDWIESLLEFSQREAIGAVGAQLLFPDDTQQHSGVILLNGNPRHPFYGWPANHPGYFHSSDAHRNCSAVTGACLMTRSEVFQSVGGFSDNFPLNYNDVDYCLKVQAGGKRIVYTPHARLYHHESVSKTGTHAEEFAAFKKAWPQYWGRDPYYNPHLGRHFRIRI